MTIKKIGQDGERQAERRTYLRGQKPLDQRPDALERGDGADERGIGRHSSPF